MWYIYGGSECGKYVGGVNDVVLFSLEELTWDLWIELMMYAYISGIDLEMCG